MSAISSIPIHIAFVNLNPFLEAGADLLCFIESEVSKEIPATGCREKMKNVAWMCAYLTVAVARDAKV